MSELLRIAEPDDAARAASPDLRAFLELGFRPLYIAGTAWALLSIGLWIFAPQWLAGFGGGGGGGGAEAGSALAWHAHEMLWGFVATIAVGFLLTAGANWTGINPLSGAPLAALGLLWLVARIGYLIPQPTAFWTAAAAESLFFLTAAGALLRAVVKSRNQRNYGIPWLLLALGITNALYLLAVARSDDLALLLARFDLGLLCMAVIALLVARRVIPFFAMRAVPGLTIPMHTRSGQVQLAAGVAAIVLGLFALNAAMALALLVAGAIAVWQLLAWKPLSVRHNPLLWILYAGYAALGAGLLTAAAHAAGLVANPALHVHLIGVGGFGLLIIGMVTRTALGHLGRPLATDHSMRAGYWLMIAAAVLRLAAMHPSGASPLLLQMAAASWIAAFALYLWRFAPLLVRPRLAAPAAAAAKPMPTPARKTINIASR